MREYSGLLCLQMCFGSKLDVVKRSSNSYNHLRTWDMILRRGILADWSI